jgi:hypothetical protein
MVDRRERPEAVDNVFDEVFSPSSVRHYLPKRSSKLGIKIARRPFQAPKYGGICRGSGHAKFSIVS